MRVSIEAEERVPCGAVRELEVSAGLVVTMEDGAVVYGHIWDHVTRHACRSVLVLYPGVVRMAAADGLLYHRDEIKNIEFTVSGPRFPLTRAMVQEMLGCYVSSSSERKGKTVYKAQVRFALKLRAALEHGCVLDRGHPVQCHFHLYRRRTVFQCTCGSLRHLNCGNECREQSTCINCDGHHHPFSDTCAARRHMEALIQQAHVHVQRRALGLPCAPVPPSPLPWLQPWDGASAASRML